MKHFSPIEYYEVVFDEFETDEISGVFKPGDLSSYKFMTVDEDGLINVHPDKPTYKGNYWTSNDPVVVGSVVHYSEDVEFKFASKLVFNNGKNVVREILNSIESYISN